MTIITYGGRALISKLHRAADSQGKFKKILGIILILTGILIASGLMKQLEIALLDAGYFDITKIESRILDSVQLD